MRDMKEEGPLLTISATGRKRDQSVETNLAAGGRNERPAQLTREQKGIESELLDGCSWLQHAMR